MPRTKTATTPLLALGAALAASWTSPTQADEVDAAAWRELGTIPRTIEIGSYALEVEETVVEDPDMQRWIPAIVPSPRAEATVWLYRTLNGAEVRYESFLGAERISFERSLSFRLGTEQLEPEGADAVIGQVYDRNQDGRLSSQELRRGNAAMARFFCARVRSTVKPGPTYQPVEGLEGATAFADAWLDQEATMAAAQARACPQCAGVPHLDKLAALVHYLQEYVPPLDGEHAALFAPGLNQILLTVEEHPDRSSTLELQAADGLTYWDTGHLPYGESALDGQIDLVTSSAPFTGASYSEVTERWERYQPGPGHQWMFEVLVDLAHAHLPRRMQVAEAMPLEPDFEVPLWFAEELAASLPVRKQRPLGLSDLGDTPPAAAVQASSERRINSQQRFSPRPARHTRP